MVLVLLRGHIKEAWWALPHCGAHAPSWCARDVAAGHVPAFELDAPMLAQIIGSRDIVWENLLVMHSPMFNLAHQYCTNIEIRNL